MFRRLQDQKANKNRKTRTRTRLGAEPLENRNLMTGFEVHGFISVDDAHDQDEVEPQETANNDIFITETSGDLGPFAGQEGSDLLIVNNGDGSDFVEVGVKDAYFSEVGRASS